MHYFDYLCGIYRICVQPAAKFKSSDDHTTFHQQPTKFYDYSHQPIGDSFLTATGFNVFKSHAKSEPTITEQIKSNDNRSNGSDIVPKTCTGDWLLRYNQNETNFNPWQAKFSHFELVPWRQQNKRIDLINAIGWEPFPDASATNQHQLRTVQKFELARTKRLRKQQLKKQREQFRRQIKIRFILSLEVRQRAMNMKRRIQPNGVMQATQQRKLVLQRDRQMIVFDERAYDLSTHWGYFSQRNKSVEELLVRDDKNNLKQNQLAIEIDRSSSVASNQSTARLSSPSKAQSESSDKSTNCSGVVVSCEKCRRRCVYAIVQF